MNYKRNLMTGLIGLAMLAAPINAAAKNNDRGSNNGHQEQRAESHNSAPARSNDHARNSAPAPAPRNEVRQQGGGRNEVRNFAPAPAPRNEFREQGGGRTWAPAPEPAHREARQGGDDGHRDWREGRNDGDGDRWNRDRDYRNYGDNDDYAEGAPYYVMPEGYAGGACAWARHLRNVYYYDRNTGHPAAAASLLPQLRRAELRCGGGTYGYDGYSNIW